MCFASSYVPTSGNQGDLTAVEKDFYRSSSRSRSIARCRFRAIHIGKLLRKIWFKYQNSQVDLLAKSKIFDGVAVVCDTADGTPLGGLGACSPRKFAEM